MFSKGHEERSRSCGRFSFPKARRILKRHQFLQIQRTGQKIHTKYFVAMALPRQDGGEGARLGITTSRRVGKAVFRNRVRRLFRDAARRLLLPELPSFDIVLIARNDLPRDLTQREVDEAILFVRRRLLSDNS